MDTFVLLLHMGRYVVMDYRKFKDYFQPINPDNFAEKMDLISMHGGNRKYIQNPAVELRKSGKVYPNLTIYERYANKVYSCDLHISISLAKLLNGHSFYEIFNENMPKVVELLISRLADMGVKVTKENMLNAICKTVHYSFNFLFRSEEDARIFLARINKCSLGGWFENNIKTFANSGHAIRFHTDTFEIVFYLKYYDVIQSVNKSMDRRKTPQEKAIAKEVLKNSRPLALVRMEIRMNGKRSVKNHLKEVLDIEKDNWLFSELFDFVKSRKVLTYYWNKIIDKPENRIVLSDWNDYDICQKIKEKYKDEKIKTVAEGMGLFYMLRSLGVKDLKAYYKLRQNRQEWYRKRRLVASFAKRFAVPNEELIAIVNNALKTNHMQLNLPLI